MNALWWWIDRWRKSTAYTDMTLEEQGAYRNLIDEGTLRGGGIPNDDRILAKASGDAMRWRYIRATVMARFELREDGWHNETLDGVLKESARRAKKQADYRERKRHSASNSAGNAAGNAAGNSDGSPDPYPDQDQSTPSVPRAHARLAYGGKILEVPKFLDAEFVKRLNGQGFDLTEFYTALDQRLAQTGESWDLRWIREQFDWESPAPERRRVERADDRPISAKERSDAERVRRSSWGSRCQHDPRCETAAACIARIVHERRAMAAA